MGQGRISIWQWIVLISQLWLFGGCQLAPTDTHVSNHHALSVETISTGGRFAKAMTLPIPETGLTLADAVEKSLRVGVDRTTRSMLPQRLTSTPAGEGKPLAEAEEIVSTLADAAREGTLGDVQVRAVVRDLTFDETTRQLLVLLLLNNREALEQDGADGGITADQQALVREIDAIIRSQRGESPSNPNVSGVSTDPGPKDGKRGFNRSSMRPEESFGSPSQRYGELMVVLRRPGATTRLVPLSFVRSSPAGDIYLENNDRVEVVSLAATSLGQRNRHHRAAFSAGSIGLTGMIQQTVDTAVIANTTELAQHVESTRLAQAIDVMIVRTSRRRASPEEYWVPRSSRGNIVTLPALQLAAGDEVELNAIQLLPIIRTSQIRGRLLTREAVEHAARKSASGMLHRRQS